MNNQIIILDDTEGFLTQHRARLVEKAPHILKQFDVPPIGLETFSNDIRHLIKRWENNGELAGDRPTCFDEAAILFVDYRLVALNIGFVTGEEVAYLARAFSGCGVIVGLNQFGDRIYDLSLCGHPESFADLNIGATDIENPGLWGNGWDGFRPWHWPLLPDAYAAFEKRVAELEDLEQPIFDFLGFSSQKVQSLPRATLEHVTKRKADAAHTTTFNEFVDSTFCLRHNDVTADLFRRRVAAARLSKWLERFVVGGQNTLVDAPHLVARYPSLLKDEPQLPILNDTAKFCPAERLPIKLDAIAKHSFAKPHWLSRPAWFWEDLKDESAIDEVRDPWNKKEVAFRFCEDASAFHAPPDCTEFVANLSTPFTRRFVRHFDKVDYVPELRFSM